MDVNFSFTDAEKAEPIRIEQVFAEKPGGGLVENASYDIPSTTAVGEKNGLYAPIKAYRLVAAVAVGDVIATGKKGVACTAVDESDNDYDLVTVTLGVAVANGKVLYQAKAASADSAEPIYKPKYVTGKRVPAGKGDFPVRLINGANLRKGTACIADEIAEILPMITLV